MEDINLHFTGDFSAIEKANNLLAALIDNNIQSQTTSLGLDPRTVHWKRVMDMNDRALRHIIVGLGGTASACRAKRASTLRQPPKSWRFCVWQKIFTT